MIGGALRRGPCPKEDALIFSACIMEDVAVDRKKIGAVELFELTSERISVLGSALVGFDFATPTANMGLARRAGKVGESE